MTELAALTKRLSDGESYLAANPDDDEAKALYWRLIREHDALALAEEQRLVVTLAYPEHVTFGDGSHTVKVCLEGARHENEWGRNDLAQFNDTMRLAK